MNIFSESYGGCLGPALPPLWDISQVFKKNVIRFQYLVSRLPLRTDAFRLGRAKSCDYVIRWGQVCAVQTLNSENRVNILTSSRQSDMGSEKWWTAISKCQCEIIKDKGGVFLRSSS